jgi:hypothetical protein
VRTGTWGWDVAGDLIGLDGVVGDGKVQGHEASDKG